MLRFFQPDPAGLIAGRWAREFRIEAHIGALGGIVKFAIDAKADLGPHLLKKKAFAPAGVRKDDLRVAASCCQPGGRTGLGHQQG